MGNADIDVKLTPLQKKINAFYTEGQQQADKALAAKLWINDANVVVDKEHQVLPGQHLEHAQYREVIERDGSMQQKIRYRDVHDGDVTCIYNTIYKIKYPMKRISM